MQTLLFTPAQRVVIGQYISFANKPFLMFFDQTDEIHADAELTTAIRKSLETCVASCQENMDDEADKYGFPRTDEWKHYQKKKAVALNALKKIPA